VWLFLDDLLIQYHRLEMRSSLDVVVDASDKAIHPEKADSAIENYEYHRKRLVDLGYLTYQEFDFPDEPEPASRTKGQSIHEQIWQAARERFPENRHVNLVHPGNTLQVWCKPDQMNKWAKFVAQLRDRISRTDNAAAGSPE
jgi:hypothetical protein